MLERLRQAAFLVKDLEDGKDLYRRYLGMETRHSKDLSRYGLRDAILPAGNGTFVELLQPVSGDSSAARYLERRGETPYMLIFETREYDHLIPHLKYMGVRLSEEATAGDYRHAFFTPHRPTAHSWRSSRSPAAVTPGPPPDPIGNPWSTGR